MNEDPTKKSTEIQKIQAPLDAEPVANYAREILMLSRNEHLKSSDTPDALPEIIFDRQWESGMHAYLLRANSLQDDATFRLTIQNTVQSQTFEYIFDGSDNGELTYMGNPIQLDHLRQHHRKNILDSLLTSAQPMAIDNDNRAEFWSIAATIAVEEAGIIQKVLDGTDGEYEASVGTPAERTVAKELDIDIEGYSNETYGVSVGHVNTAIGEYVKNQIDDIAKRRYSQTVAPKLYGKALLRYYKSLRKND